MSIVLFVVCVFLFFHYFFFFKQKTAYEMRISGLSSDVCSSDLVGEVDFGTLLEALNEWQGADLARVDALRDELLGAAAVRAIEGDRKSVVQGKSVSVRVDLGGRRIIKKKIKN